MVRPDLAVKKIGRTKGWLDDAEEILSRPTEEFLADVKNRDLATFYLFLSIQECIDLAAHWVADAGWDVPDEAGSTFDLLAEHGAIDHDLAAVLRGTVGLRNRIAHGYGSVNHQRVHQEYRGGVAALRSFLSLVMSEAGL
jgi:uncharacterized protein YutE (UPF0331/DUF86 family)